MALRGFRKREMEVLILTLVVARASVRAPKVVSGVDIGLGTIDGYNESAAARIYPSQVETTHLNDKILHASSLR